MKEYNKLVRDRIPEIIEGHGQKCVVTVLSPEEHLSQLGAKLAEEIKEYQASGDVMELVDIAEIVEAAARLKGVSIGEFRALQEQKRHRNGGFEKGLFLVRADEPDGRP